jgi:hypothetical protein
MREIRVKKRGKLSPLYFRFTTSGSGNVISGYATSGDVISGYATSGDVTAPPQIINGWCLYTTNIHIILTVLDYNTRNLEVSNLLYSNENIFR